MLRGVGYQWRLDPAELRAGDPAWGVDQLCADGASAGAGMERRGECAGGGG